MSTNDPLPLEHGITNGFIQIVIEDGKTLPAYWAHPNTGRRFPAVALIHDWWGITTGIRSIAHFFAQAGYYVIVPDLFEGQVANTPAQAKDLVTILGDNGYPRIHAALSVLESHMNTNRDVAAVGIGMGGSLAFEAAIERDDLEAAVAFGGFPQRYLNSFRTAKAPILAFYGQDEPYILPPVIAKLRQELSANTRGLTHEIVMVDGLAHEIFPNTTDAERQQSQHVLSQTLSFLERHLKGPTRPLTSRPI